MSGLPRIPTCAPVASAPTVISLTISRRIGEGFHVHGRSLSPQSPQTPSMRRPHRSATLGSAARHQNLRRL